MLIESRVIFGLALLIRLSIQVGVCKKFETNKNKPICKKKVFGLLENNTLLPLFIAATIRPTMFNWFIIVITVLIVSGQCTL